jgi:hypothetical protein
MLEAPDENQSFPHKDITEKIIGGAFEVDKGAELISPQMNTDLRRIDA